MIVYRCSRLIWVINRHATLKGFNGSRKLKKGSYLCECVTYYCLLQWFTTRDRQFDFIFNVKRGQIQLRGQNHDHYLSPAATQDKQLPVDRRGCYDSRNSFSRQQICSELVWFHLWGKTRTHSKHVYKMSVFFMKACWTQKKSRRSDWSWWEQEFGHRSYTRRTATSTYGGNRHLHVFLTLPSPLSPCFTSQPCPLLTSPMQEATREERPRSGLSLSAIVLLQVFTEETHTCTGWTKIVTRPLLIITFWLICNSLRQMKPHELYLADLQSQSTPLSRSQEGDGGLSQVRNPGGFRLGLGLDYQNLSSVCRPDGTAF